MNEEKKKDEPFWRDLIPEELEDLWQLTWKDKLRIGRFGVVVVLLFANEDVFSLYTSCMVIYLCYAGYGLTKTSIYREFKLENTMEKEKDTINKESLKGLFEGAVFNEAQIVIAQSGSKVVYKEVKPCDDEKPQVSDEQIANAILAINGKDKPLNEYQRWLGVCCMLSWKYGYPRNLKDCCERINLLPLEGLEYICKYDNIRKLPATNPFIHEDARQWECYSPKERERVLFNGCLAVAQAFETEIQKQIE